MTHLLLKIDWTQSEELPTIPVKYTYMKFILYLVVLISFYIKVEFFRKLIP